MTKLSEAELDARHEAAVARFPGGMTPAQYRRVVLESADENGRVYPHSLADYFLQMSLLMGMMMDGLIQHRGGYHVPFDWHITETGRSALTRETTDG